MVYPTDKQKDVPLAFFDDELPDPAPERQGMQPVGYPITVTFQPGAEIKDARCRLTFGE